MFFIETNAEISILTIIFLNSYFCFYFSSYI